MNAKERIEIILKSTKRPGIEKLLAQMDLCGFYESPCSSKYHLSKPGGLAEHSLNVFRIAIAMVDALYTRQGIKITQEGFADSLAICALLHDLGKAGQFGKAGYIEETESGTYATNKDLLYVPHEIRSVAIVSRFIKLTEEEQFAILYHNGLYGELQSVKGNETPLYMILHFADMWASRVVEMGELTNEN